MQNRVRALESVATGHELPVSELVASAFLELLLEFKRVRARTESLCDPLEPEDMQVQSMPDVSPPKWHLAHTSWFFEKLVLEPLSRRYEPFNSKYSYLFNSYYKGQGAHHPRPQRGLLSRPTRVEVGRYRDWVDSQVFSLLSSEGAALREGASGVELCQRIRLGLQHEEQHQELLMTDIKHILGSNPLRPVYQRAQKLSEALSTRWEFLEFRGGVQTVGWDSERNGEGFSFDHERPAHSVYLQPFCLASRPVTQGEYLEFIEEEGYRDPLLWLSDGWDLVQREGWRAPLYWECDQGRWSIYSLEGGMQPFREHEPVCHLSYFEADAYARWRGARLPTEFEWEYAVGAARDELAGLGRVWEWTASAYLPYPGFAPFSGAFSEYNRKFMSGQMVLRGGSVASPPGHVRPSYRNFFQPSARWQFSGVRLAQ